MERKQNSLEKFLCTIWCYFITFWDNLFQNVTTDESGCLYIRHEKGALVLHPISLSKKNLDSKEDLKVGQMVRKRLLGKFKYNLSIENSCIVIPGESGTVKIFIYSLSKGWFFPDRDEHASIEHLLRLSQIRENATNIKFFYAEMI